MVHGEIWTIKELFVYPNEYIYWSIQIVMYPFMTGLVAGAFVLSSLYHVFGVKQLKEGSTEDQVFAAWAQELLRMRVSTKSALAKQAVETWSERKNVPYWQVHTMNLDAGFVDGPLRAGMTIDFEPIASIGGQGYYLEDMFLITKDSAERLTPVVPYSADEIEAVMAGRFK